MKKLHLIIILTICMSRIVSAQDWETNKTAQTEIKNLAFLVGEWEGSGWMMGQDRVQRSINQTEKVQFKLDSTALLIEGTGRLPDGFVHNAMAFLTSKGEHGQYDFQAYLPSGEKGTYKSELVNNKFNWYPTDFIRYTIYVDEEGKWKEVGEINKGGNWYQFSEMTLEKVKDEL